MTKQLRYPCLLATAFLLAAVSNGFAQDPFGGPAAEPAVPAAGPALPAAPQNVHPLVLAIRESNPTTPPELVEAMRALMDFGDRTEAKVYLNKLKQLNLQPAALAVLGERIGSGFFLRLARDPEMQPLGAEIGTAVISAYAQAMRNPARVAPLIRHLSSSTPEIQRTALNDLKKAGDVAVSAMIGALADPTRAGEHEVVKVALIELGEVSIDPLLGVMESSDNDLKTHAAQVLGKLRANRAVLLLVRPYLFESSPRPLREAAGQALIDILGTVPSKREGEIYLRKQIAAYLDGQLTGAVDYQGMVTLWRWDEEQHLSTPRKLLAGDASLLLAAQLAGDLYALYPDNEEYERLLVLTSLEAAKRVNGLFNPLAPEGKANQIATTAGPAVVREVLAEAMQRGRVAAAIGAVEVLGNIGETEDIHSATGQPTALVSALRHGDRRLRFAAALAIMKLDPQQAYAGSSHLIEALQFIARTVNSRKALIAHPRVGQSQTIVGMFAEMDIEMDTAPTGKAAFLLAAENPDYEFVLLSDALDRTDDNATIQSFRMDPRTAGLPIGLMARKENLEAAQRLAQQDQLTEAFPRPHEKKDAAFWAFRLLDLTGRNFISQEERLDQARIALAMLKKIADNQQAYGFYDLHRAQAGLIRALAVGEISADAAAVLGRIGSPEAQSALVDLASLNPRPIAERNAAAAAFAAAVQSRGVLLTTEQIRRQYERYNLSATLDRDTQNVLGKVLDAIEAPSLAEE